MNKKMLLPLMTGLLLCFVAGCKESAPPEKPVVVKKSIDQTATTAPETKTEQTATQPAPPQDQKEARGTDAPAPKAPEASEAPAAAPAAEATPPVPAEGPAPAAEKAPAADTDAPAPEAVQTEPQAPTAGAAEAQPGEQPAETEAEAVSLKNAFLKDETPALYDPTGKVDPFAALFSEKGEAGAADESKPKRPLTPLEKIDISQLKLVAVLLAESGDRAMVEDATGKPYILRPGTYVGINSGTVSQIQKDRVVIEETSKDILGRETSRTRELKLQKPLGEE